jgi:hypothetical protein
MGVVALRPGCHLIVEAAGVYCVEAARLARGW